MKRKSTYAAKALLTRIAIRRLKRSRETVPLALGMLFSVLLISFFLFFALTVSEGRAALVEGLPHTTFVRSMADGMRMAATILSVATLLTMRTWARLSVEASAPTVSILHSLGAKSTQRWYLLGKELSMQYLPSLLTGMTLGAVSGILIGRTWTGSGTVGADTVLTYVFLWLAILAVSGILLVLCYAIPHIRIKRVTLSATESLRRRGQSVSTESHSYRHSNTYKRQSLLKRLATKSVDFYKARYKSLAVSLAVSVFYPLLALLLIYHLMGASVILDTNPFDTADTTGAVASSVMGLLSVIVMGFLLLTAQGVWSGILLIRTQLEQRRLAGRAYLPMGMTERDFRRVMGLEIRSLLLRCSLYLCLFILIANFCFTQIMG